MNWYKKSSQNIVDIALQLDPTLDSNADAIMLKLYKSKISPKNVRVTSGEFTDHVESAVSELSEEAGDEPNVWRELQKDRLRNPHKNDLDDIIEIVKKKYKGVYAKLTNKTKPIPTETDDGAGIGGVMPPM